ncbi:NACHT domain-containing protein, partial [Frankia sp. CIT1]|uniref:NACHT domain-containing protein n=1 Tax=Frankia sp. CIT1 TaxID=2880974 RepID=UPI001EF721C2
MGGNTGEGRIPSWLILIVVTIGAGAVALASGDRWAGVLAVAALTLALAAYLADRKDSRAGDIDMAPVADRLADQLTDQWSAEAHRRDLTRPPLAVSWQPADASLVQPWAYLQRLAAAGVGWTRGTPPGAGPHELAGTGSDLAAVFDRVPTGRLVVLGEPGSGKTVLLLRLALDLLARRDPGGPVPLLIPVASWNPDRVNLYDWLETQMIREHPWLASTAVAGISRARALLTAGLILPVLDGLDEIR